MDRCGTSGEVQIGKLHTSEIRASVVGRLPGSGLEYVEEKKVSVKEGHRV